MYDFAPFIANEINPQEGILSVQFVEAPPIRRSNLVLWNDARTPQITRIPGEPVSVQATGDLWQFRFSSVPSNPAKTFSDIQTSLETESESSSEATINIVLDLSALHFLTLAFCGQIFLFQEQLLQQNTSLSIIISPTTQRKQPAITEQIQRKLSACYILLRPGVAERIR